MSVTPELIAGGLPLTPEHILFDFGNGDYSLTHAAQVAVMSTPEYSAVVLGIARPDQPTGLFMGYTPAQARSIAAWLLVSADEIDGGVVKS